MRPTDRMRATLIHASARYTVNYGRNLRFAGQELARPTRRTIDTRHGPVPIYEYGAGDGPAIVHFHGGAWLMRYPHMDDWWCRYLAAATGFRVINVDFSVGPYVAYPVAQEQCHDVAAAIAADSPVALTGFSSGGGLAASVALQARDLGTFTPRLQVLGVPALDVASEVPRTRGMISSGFRDLVRRVYFPDAARRAEPYASPLLAANLSGLAPAIVLTGEHDTLRPDGDRYARRLRAAGVDVLHEVTPGVDHYFLTDDPKRAKVTMEMVADEIKARLHP